MIFALCVGERNCLLQCRRSVVYDLAEGDHDWILVTNNKIRTRTSTLKTIWLIDGMKILMAIFYWGMVSCRNSYLRRGAWA